ncbi:MAG TPA: cellulase family glycosylhydrolase [Candidatus Acidoferrum sp.]|nr:cellulase family glycosylhydrolase [Candidatus Acidoferrum sp.]
MKRFVCLAFLLSTAVAVAFGEDGPVRWSETQASAWYGKQGWLVGSNYLPASASNELEMWQADSFDPKRIDLEFGWAESIGLNTMRVFLHDLLWQQDAKGFTARMDQFLKIAEKHHIKPMFVLFDSCWDPAPRLGPQLPPRPGIHNSRWVQSPGAAALGDPSQYPRLEGYVKGVLKAFGKDDRVLAWDVWNEPDNTNSGSYGSEEPPDKVQRVRTLLPQVFRWAREAGPNQPLTSGVWQGDWSAEEKLSPVEKIQLENSDVVSFHNYDKPEEFSKRVAWLERYHRPLICTEYMARGNGSTFEGILPVAKREHVAAINWGLVKGKAQTFLPWDSWQRPYTDREPAIWFHEIFRSDGQPYRTEETELIRRITKN